MRYKILPVEEVLEKYDYLPRVLAIRLTGHEDEDLQQIGRIKVFTSYKSHYDGSSHPRTFFWNAARIAMIDELRRRTLRHQREGTPLDESWMGPDDDNPADQVDHWSLRDQMRDLIKSLPTGRQKLIIIFLYYKGYNQKEVAQMLRVSEGTVSLDRQKALRFMRERLEGQNLA